MAPSELRTIHVQYLPSYLKPLALELDRDPWLDGGEDGVGDGKLSPQELQAAWTAEDFAPAAFMSDMPGAATLHRGAGYRGADLRNQFDRLVSRYQHEEHHSRDGDRFFLNAEQVEWFQELKFDGEQSPIPGRTQH
ncbi:MAG: hypothetical protein AAF658_02440 [Myxococcota bacterium]